MHYNKIVSQLERIASRSYFDNSSRQRNTNKKFAGCFQNIYQRQVPGSIAPMV